MNGQGVRSLCGSIHGRSSRLILQDKNICSIIAERASSLSCRRFHGGGSVSIACIVIPHFALRVALLDRPELDGAPLVLGPVQGGQTVVNDATPEAAAQGVRTGLGLREAVALCPEAVILAPHPVRENAAAERIVTGLEMLSPTVEIDAGQLGCYAIDLTGLERLLGPPSLATERLLATLPALFRPRAGVAPNRFTARVAAYG